MRGGTQLKSKVAENVEACSALFSSVQFIKPSAHINPQCLVKKSYICIRVERTNRMRGNQ